MTAMVTKFFKSSSRSTAFGPLFTYRRTSRPPSDEEIGPTSLLYFCCLPPSGVLLSRGQERKFLLFFQLSDGYNGEDMFFHVKDFPPILNAQWRFRHAQ